MTKYMKSLAFVLVIIGALNWGFVGFFNWNLVSFLLGEGFLARLIYALVGLSGVWLVYTNLFHKKEG